MENQLQKYQHTGRLFVWKFRPENRNSPGWNMSGDAAGCHSLMTLLEQMQASSFPSQSTIATHPATTHQVKRATGSKPYQSVDQVTLRYRKGVPQLWFTEEGGEGIRISFGEREITMLQTALQRIIKGEGNFAIGDDQEKHLLYFWPFFELT